MRKNWFHNLIICALIILAAWCGVLMSDAQNVERQGNNFIAVSTRSTKTEADQTKFTYKTTDGKIYPIFITKTGSCFIKKISAKTGKEYKMYLKPEVRDEICRELGVKYTGRSSVKK